MHGGELRRCRVESFGNLATYSAKPHHCERIGQFSKELKFYFYSNIERISLHSVDLCLFGNFSANIFLKKIQTKCSLKTLLVSKI